jgi:hypothetical protein
MIIPGGLTMSYEMYAEKAKLRLGSADKSDETNDRQKMVELIDQEIESLSVQEKSLMETNQKRNKYRLSAALIPGQEASDRLLRCAAHLSREIDRTLNWLERLKRMQTGQPMPPRVDININPNP